MHDPDEGVTADGMISTGARRSRCATEFEPVLARAIAAVADRPDASLYVYGSVPCGTAEVGRSDVDLLSVGLPSERAAELSAGLSAAFASLGRGVEIAAAEPDDLSGDGDEAYGFRVFLRHYCVHLTGPDLRNSLPDYRPDLRAARGFNGDIADHLRRWRGRLTAGESDVAVGRSVGRKTLLAVAGLVSIHDQDWTTDRGRAAARGAEIWPELAPVLHRLRDLSTGAPPGADELGGLLDAGVPEIIDRFEKMIGLWDEGR